MSEQELHEHIPGLRRRIMDAARELFLQHGYSKVSTIEIAQSLGISKKTLYREFESKEEILRAVILPKLEESARMVDAILENKVMPFRDKLREVMSMIGYQHQKVSHILMRDIFIHSPAIWEEIQTYRKARFQKFGTLLTEGMEKKVFRSDIKPEVMLKLYTSAVDSLMVPSALEELPCSAKEVFQSIVTILMEGILREEAREEFVRSEPIQPAH